MAVLSKSEIDQLDVATRLELIEQLWDSIAADPQATSRLPLSDEERDMMRTRLAAYQANPTATRPWSEVRAELIK